MRDSVRAEIASADTVKLLVAGQRGMGKTTELRRFGELLEDSDFLPVFLPFGAQRSISEAGLIYSMAHALHLEPKAGLDEHSFKPRQDWYGREEISNILEKGSKGRASLGGEILILGAKGEVERKRLTKTKRSYEVVRDIHELVNRFNTLISKARRKSKRRVVFVVDDIDKVQDPSSIENTFIHASHILCAIDCPCIFTVPITYSTSPYLRIAALPYHGIYRVPAVDLRDENGKRNDYAFQFMQRVFELRMPFNPAPKELLQVVLVMSGGVLIDAMRMLRGICKRKILNPALSVDEQMVDGEFQQLVDDYKFVFNTPQLWRKLSILCRAKDTKAYVTDDMLPELLYKMIVIEYRQKYIWFDLHPAARRLYEQNADVIEKAIDLE